MSLVGFGTLQVVFGAEGGVGDTVLGVKGHKSQLGVPKCGSGVSLSCRGWWWPWGQTQRDLQEGHRSLFPRESFWNIPWEGESVSQTFQDMKMSPHRVALLTGFALCSLDGEKKSENFPKFHLTHPILRVWKGGRRVRKSLGGKNQRIPQIPPHSGHLEGLQGRERGEEESLRKSLGGKIRKSSKFHLAHSILRVWKGGRGRVP